MRGVNVTSPAPSLPAFAKRLVENGSPEEATFLGFDAFVVPSDEATAWTGTIKSTVHDFHVREVAREHGNPAGVPVRLTELAPEVEDVVGEDAERGNWRGFEWADFEDPAARDSALTEIAPMLGPGGGESLTAFLKAPSESRDRRGVRAVLVADKTQRRRLHELAKTALPCVETSTDVVPADKARAMGLEVPDAAVDEATGEVRVLKLAIRRRSMTRQRRWPRDIPPYTRFVLHKQGEDHASAIALLCRATGRTPRTFSGAGVKDRWAVTVQAMSAYHVWPDELARVNRFSPTVRVGNCEPSTTEVTLGRLWGNEFSIVLRDISGPELAGAAAAAEATAVDAPLPPQCAPIPANASPEAVAAARTVAASLSRWAAAEYRFVNYFGAQRFGTFPVRTHEVGVAMLRGEFAAASCMVLGFRPEEAESYLAELGIGLDDAADPSQGVETEEEEEAAAAAAAAAEEEDEPSLAAASAAAAAELEEDDDKPVAASSASSAEADADGATATLSTSQLAKAARRAEEWRALPKRERIARRILSIIRRRMADRSNRAAPDAVLQRRWVAPQELAVVEALATYHPNNTVMPVVSVAKGSRMMFLHAVQSWVFNHAASARVRRMGMQPVAGDLVLDKEALAAAGIDPDSVESGAGASTLRGEEDGDFQPADDEAAAATDTDGGDATPAGSEADSDQAAAAAEQAKNRKLLAEDGLPPVRVLSQEDVDSGKWTIDDVVLALPGKDVVYSQHACGAPLAAELLARLGLSDPRLDAIAAASGDAAIDAANNGPCLWGGSGSPVVRCSMGDMTGAYRSLVARAGDAGFSVQWYDKAPGARIPQAVQSDVDVLDAAAMQQTVASLTASSASSSSSSSSSSSAAAAAAAASSAPAAPAAVPDMQAPWPCVVLRLRLRQGVYATMAMREAMRGDPSVSAAPVGVFARHPASGKRDRDADANAPDSKRGRAAEGGAPDSERS